MDTTSPSPTRSERPIRLRAHPVTWDECQFILATEEREITAEMEPAVLARAHIDRLVRQTVAPSEAQMMAWATHPDERVVIKCLRALSSFVEAYPAVHTSCVQRALRIAENEGVLWTPVLDALAVSGLWRDVEHPQALPMVFPRPTQRMPALEEWVRGEQSADVLCDAAVLVHYPDLRTRVAKYSHALDENGISALLETFDGIDSLLANENHTPEQWAMIFGVYTRASNPMPRALEAAFHQAFGREMASLDRRAPASARNLLMAASRAVPHLVLTLLKGQPILHPDIPWDEVLLPLLSHTDARVRMEAIRLTANARQASLRAPGTALRPSGRVRR